MTVQLRLTRDNRYAVAALLARLERLLPAEAPAPTLLEDPAARPGVLLCSFMTAQAQQVRDEVVAWRAELGDSLRLVAGGPHPSGDPAGTLAMGFDWVVRGEAEAGFDALMRALLAGERPPPGVISGGRRRPLDEQPCWPRSGRLFVPIELTRGCPMACAFCQTPRLHGRRPRHRSLADIERHVRHAVRTGHTFTRFIAPNALAWGAADARAPDIPRLERLFVRLRRLGLEKVFFGHFPSEVRPESVTVDAMALLRDHVDNRRVVVGLQSGSDDVLRAIRRGHTVAEGVTAVERIAAAGFTPSVDFVFGFPGETAADRDQSRALVRHLADTYDARINIHVFTPLPGTPLADAPPGRVDPQTARLLAYLTGRGNAAGHDVGPASEPL